MLIESIGTFADFITTPWVLLILLASVLYAAGNYIDELLLCKYNQEVGTMVIISTLFGAVVASIFLLLAYMTGTSLHLETPLLLQALGIGILEALWVIPYLYATERSGALIAGPLFQALPVFALFFESFYGVVPPQIQLLGAAVIILGGIVLSIEKEEDEEGNTSHSIDWITIGMMTISIVIVSLIYVLFKNAAVSSNFLTVGFWTGIGTLVTGMLIYGIWQPYRNQFNTFCASADYKAVGIQFFNEILDAGGVYMTNLANTLGPSVMVVTAFNATQPVAIGIIGATLSFFGFTSISTDKTDKNGWVFITLGILLLAVGTVIIALGSSN
jgi:hypothetical protein